MPELPEVETIKNDLKKVILKKKIKGVDVKKKKLVRGSLSGFIKTLTGNYIKDINRRGKLLIFTLSKNRLFLLVHLKMTGQLIYIKGAKVVAGGHGELGDDRFPNKYSHIIFKFKDDSRLFFNDQRQFGYMQIVDSEELEKVENKFGIEPLSAKFILKKFTEILQGKTGNIKALLMNQKFIAGIGNIYADEICFYARVKPMRSVKILTKPEIKKIHQGIGAILRKAIKYRGTTFSDYRDGDGKKGNFKQFLKVYGKGKQKCQRCKKGVIKKVRAAGRGTRYCEECQK